MQIDRLEGLKFWSEGMLPSMPEGANILTWHFRIYTQTDSNQTKNIVYKYFLAQNVIKFLDTISTL